MYLVLALLLRREVGEDVVLAHERGSAREGARLLLQIRRKSVAITEFSSQDTVGSVVDHS